jgi:hypothetical protein
VSAKDINTEEAKNDLKAAEAELAKWGDKAQDGDYQNLMQRESWAKARLEAAAH